jgi:hypothetical protein
MRRVDHVRGFLTVLAASAPPSTDSLTDLSRTRGSGPARDKTSAVGPSVKSVKSVIFYLYSYARAGFVNGEMKENKGLWIEIGNH